MSVRDQERVTADDSPLFAGVPKEQVERVLAAGRRRRYAKREVVFHVGDVAASVHLITRGRFAVRVETPYGEEATLVVLPPGEIFGEIALIEPDRTRTATVQALEAGETLAIDSRDFADLRRKHPAVNDVLMAILAHKVGRYTDQLLEALYVPAEIRVVRRLLELADIYSADGDVVEIPLTQQDLAGLAGTYRATVNKVLRQAEERGSVKLARGRTLILDRSRLERRVG